MFDFFFLFSHPPFFSSSESGSSYVAQAGLEVMISCLSPPNTGFLGLVALTHDFGFD